MRIPCVLGLCILTAVPATGGQLECPWEWANPTPPRVNVYQTVYAMGSFLAVGADGLILESTDGGEWRTMDSGTDADLYGVEFAAQRWVAVGDGEVISSRHGEVWNVVFSDHAVTFHDVEYGASRFVAVATGLSGDVLTSGDGVTWTRIATSLPDPTHGLTWADGEFFACAAGEIYRSSDGLIWTEMGSVPFSGLKRNLFDFERFDLAWSQDGLFWMGGYEVWASADGREWSISVTVDGCPDFSAFVGILAAPSALIVSGYGACPGSTLEPEAQLYSSVNGGESWTLGFRQPAGGFPALAHAYGSYVALGAAGDVLTSGDAVNWDCSGSGCTSNACADGFSSLAVSEDGLIAAGGVGLCDPNKRLGGGTIASALGGWNWSVDPVDTEQIFGVARSSEIYAAVGDAWAGWSADGLQWQTNGVPTPLRLNSVAWGDGQFVAVGQEGVLLSTTDGVQWTELWSTTNQDLERVVWDGEYFFAVGRNGTILRSRDTFTWNRGETSSAADLYGVASGDDRLVAVGTDGTVLVSSDGLYWFTNLIGTDADLLGVAWNGTTFAIVGVELTPGGADRAVVFASGEGTHWTRFPVDAPALRDVVGIDGGFAAAGDHRVLLAAPCLGTLATLDPPLYFARLGGHGDLILSLDGVTEVDVEVTLEASTAGVVSLPVEVVIPRGSESVGVPVQAIGPGTTWVTAVLPDGIGGGRTSSMVKTGPFDPAPRRPSDRRSP